MEDFNQGDYSDKFSDYYRYIRTIGKGSFGYVVQALDKYTGAEVAVKILKKSELGDEKIEELRQEGNILSQLNHLNIVKFIHVKESENRIFIAMEFIKGGTLAQLIKKRKLSENSAIKAMTGIFRAVEYLHKHGIVHRDLKPENILVENPKDLSTLKVADFGLCTNIDLSAKVKEHCGTMIYMAPEQATHKFYSREVDLWSCGIILYMLIHRGKHPLRTKHDSRSAYLSKLANPKWKFPSSFPNLAQNLFLKLMKLKPIERYTASQALAHPWITRNSCEIPLTYLEKMSNYNADIKMKNLIYMLLFSVTIDSKHIQEEERLYHTMYNPSYKDEDDFIYPKDKKAGPFFISRSPNISPRRRRGVDDALTKVALSPTLRLSTRNKSARLYYTKTSGVRPITATYRIRKLK
jgi:calcium/calmodulin-dependent protein kinase I